MTQLEKYRFYDCIDKNNKAVFKANGIPAIKSSDVKQLNIGQKYFYSLAHNNAYQLIHKKLIDRVFSKFEINNAATAFRENKSYLNFLEPHLRGYYFLRLDLSSFFHSISVDLMRDSFSDIFKEKFVDDVEKQKVVDGLINLVTYKVPKKSSNERFRDKVILPMGFKTSPIISNIVFRKVDILIQKYCSSKNISYSRYADDMLFSSEKNSKFVHSESFNREVEYLLSMHKFKLNKRKTIKACHTISLNGYVVESKDIEGHAGNLRISNKKTKIIEKLNQKLLKAKKENKVDESVLKILNELFKFSKKKHRMHNDSSPEFIDMYLKHQLLNKINGYRSYLISLIQFDKKYKCINAEAINKYNTIIDELSSHADRLSKRWHY